MWEGLEEGEGEELGWECLVGSERSEEEVGKGCLRRGACWGRCMAEELEEGGGEFVSFVFRVSSLFWV